MEGEPEWGSPAALRGSPLPEPIWSPYSRGKPGGLREPELPYGYPVASQRLLRCEQASACVARSRRRRAGVAEWQTRQTQNLLPVREWGFKSLHPHQSGLPPTKIGRLAPTVDGLRKARAQGGDERSEI